MEIIALPEQLPNLIIKRAGWGACGAEMSRVRMLPPMTEFHAASIKT
jgi:hypothetical protein